MMTEADVPHRALRVAGNVIAVTLWAAVLAVVLLAVMSASGCASDSAYRIQINPATGEGTATLTETVSVTTA